MRPPPVLEWPVRGGEEEESRDTRPNFLYDPVLAPRPWITEELDWAEPVGQNRSVAIAMERRRLGSTQDRAGAPKPAWRRAGVAVAIGDSAISIPTRSSTRHSRNISRKSHPPFSRFRSGGAGVACGLRYPRWFPQSGGASGDSLLSGDARRTTARLASVRIPGSLRAASTFNYDWDTMRFCSFAANSFL
jgi:hypothetical protein